jgi:hypothetical protein
LGNYHAPLKDALCRKNKKIIGEFSVRAYDETGPWVIIGGGHRRDAIKVAQRHGKRTSLYLTC